MFRCQQTVKPDGEYLTEITGATYWEAVNLLNELRSRPTEYPGSTVAVPELLNGLPYPTFTVTSSGRCPTGETQS